MTDAKEGYENEWKQASEECVQLEAMINELTGAKNLFRAWDVEEKCWIPPEMVAVTGEGKILTRDGEDEEWLEEIIQVVIVY